MLFLDLVGFAEDKKEEEKGGSLGAKCRSDRIELGRRLNSWTMTMKEARRAENPKKGTAQRGAAGGYNLTKTVEQERRFGRDQAR